MRLKIENRKLKNEKHVDLRGIDPLTLYMQSIRSTTELQAPNTCFLTLRDQI